MFPNFDEARALYDSGNFVHANSPLIGDGVDYGESFIPRSYVHREYSDAFELVDFVERPGEHPIIIRRKRG